MQTLWDIFEGLYFVFLRKEVLIPAGLLVLLAFLVFLFVIFHPPLWRLLGGGEEEEEEEKPTLR